MILTCSSPLVAAKGYNRMDHSTSQENNTDAVRVLSVMVFGTYLRHCSFESVVLGSLVV